MADVTLPDLAPEEVVVHLNGRTHRLKYHRGETLLETMRRAGLASGYTLACQGVPCSAVCEIEVAG